MLAHLQGESLIENGQKKYILQRDAEAEAKLIKRLSNELGLISGIPRQFSDEQAIEYSKRLTGWNVKGEGLQTFESTPLLTPQMTYDNGRVDCIFSKVSSQGNIDVSIDRVMQSFKQGARFIQADDGKWYSLPTDWLTKYGDRAAKFLEYRNAHTKLPTYLGSSGCRIVRRVRARCSKSFGRYPSQAC